MQREREREGKIDIFSGILDALHLLKFIISQILHIYTK